MRWSEDKLKPPRPPANEDLRDPAQGEKVPRCRICTLPETKDNPLYRGLFVWTGGSPYKRLATPQNQCKRCTDDPYYQPDDPKYQPGDADPLQLEDAA